MQVSSSQLGFRLFLLATATIFVRPWDIFPALSGLPIYMLLIVSAAVILRQQILEQLVPENLLYQPITFCVLGVLVAIPVSHLTNGYVGGAIQGSVMMIKSVLYYLVLVAAVDSTERFRSFMRSLAIWGMVCIGISLADYHGLIAIESLKHIQERLGYTMSGQDIFLARLCGLGMFSDPNDMSLLIVTVGFLCLIQLQDRYSGSGRYLWLAAFPLLLLAIYDTHSRGGLIAAGAAIMAYLSMKHGRKFALLAIGMGVLAAPLALGRMANIDLSEGTGQQRIRLWAEGFNAIQSHKVLFGIGQNMYTDLTDYVAHNSYVHSFVELGLFGGTFFFGCLFFAGYGLYLLKRDRMEVDDERLIALQPYVAAILAAWAAGFLSLSRVYPVSTYIIIGMAAAYLNITGIHLNPVRPVLWLNKPMAQRWVASSAMAFVAMFLATKLFARF